MKDLLLLASHLDELGLYKVASKLDKIAQVQNWYPILINQYKEYILDGRRDEAELLLGNVVSGRQGRLTPQQINKFKKQALRIRNENPIRSISNTLDDADITEYGNDFGLNMAKDKRIFDIKWKQMVRQIYKERGNTPEINQALQNYYKRYVADTY
jgi:hypothetical protein